MADLDPIIELGADGGQVAEDTVVANVDGEETRAYKRAARPHTPPKADWDSHLPLHLNYIIGLRIAFVPRRWQRSI